MNAGRNARATTSIGRSIRVGRALVVGALLTAALDVGSVTRGAMVAPPVASAAAQRAALHSRAAQTEWAAHAYLPLALHNWRNPTEKALPALAAAVTGTRLYLGVGPRVAVIDVSDPTDPRTVGLTISVGTACTVVDLVAAGDFAYSLCQRNADAPAAQEGADVTLTVIDATEPERPHAMGKLDFSGWTASLALVDATLLVGDARRRPTDQYGLSVVDVADPRRPTRTSFVVAPGVPVDMAVDGDVAYAAAIGFTDDCPAGLVSVDVSKPAAPDVLGYMAAPPGNGGCPVAVAARGPYAYLASTPAGAAPALLTVDVRAPAAPIPGGRLDLPVPGGVLAGLAADLAPGPAADSGSLVAYFAGEVARLMVLHPAEPDSPPGAVASARFAGEVALPRAVRLPRSYWPCTNLATTAGGYAYLAGGTGGGLYVVDVRAPDAPAIVAIRRLPEWVR